MLRYRAGNADAFAKLYERHKGPLYRYFLRHCGVPAVAEELFQDVCLNVVRAREQYTVQAKFSTYLYRLAQNRNGWQKSESCAALAKTPRLKRVSTP
jgi:RNA polymerase sigma-70 factor (ECF subfamily)